jgi:hypothetical protein
MGVKIIQNMKGIYSSEWFWKRHGLRADRKVRDAADSWVEPVIGSRLFRS